ncbi:MAG: capsular polysaccharide biosynthesis protein CapF [Ruminococcaceae bacterium]|nr:capsular polysaccharide biosynthesis protein CapF [Oscillospiraceae bacterium]
MKVLITGAKGFVGKNLCATLLNIVQGKDRSFGTFEDLEIFEYDIDTAPEMLEKWCGECDFVLHLAGVNRPKEQEEFMQGNFGFTSTLLSLLEKHKNACPIVISSSTQAVLDNPYGRSKKAGEELLRTYGERTGAKVMIYRFPNVFGKWCRPNYNSAVATFCHNIAHDLPITVNDPSVKMRLVYIDDVVAELIAALKGEAHEKDGLCYVPVEHEILLGRIAELIYSFRDSRKNLCVPNMADAFETKLYATYLSYLPENAFSYPLTMNVDQRGSFTEMIRTSECGQFSINISKPGITKGNHWHHTKNEKFLVVSGNGVIRFRKIDSDQVIEYFVSGDKLEVVDIPTGYTHNIENLGQTDMVTVMWASECFDPNKPDTFYLEV